jgi:predicted GIY-YIG superfamily endonuclease
LCFRRRIASNSDVAATQAFIYILRCADRTFYIGMARNVAHRLKVHNLRKGAKYTRSRLPVKVIYQEGPMSIGRALSREYQLKQLTREKKQAFIAGRLIVRPLPRKRG